MREESGEVAKSNRRPHILADYFEKKQWGQTKSEKQNQENWPNHLLFDQCSPIRTDYFSLEELDRVLQNCKNGKSPGPDGIPLEFLKWLNNEARLYVLDILNTCWELKIIPEQLEIAEVVTLYKKGNVEDPANYRPISLLQSLYKLLAALIKNRLADHLEDKVWKLQYGFRQKRSTNQALFICRRLQDIAESGGSKLTLLFLDWEKAFDQIYQDELVNAVRRMNLPQEITDMIQVLYDGLKFRIKGREGKSTYRPQRTGIRQGCPLSPYLFIIFISVLMHDVHEEVAPKQSPDPINDFTDFNEIFYADDTMIFGSNIANITRTLHCIEKHSARYGMRLNRKKCAHIDMNRNVTLKFANGDKVPQVTEEEY